MPDDLTVDDLTDVIEEMTVDDVSDAYPSVLALTQNAPTKPEEN